MSGHRWIQSAHETAYKNLNWTRVDHRVKVTVSFTHTYYKTIQTHILMKLKLNDSSVKANDSSDIHSSSQICSHAWWSLLMKGLVIESDTKTGCLFKLNLAETNNNISSSEKRSKLPKINTLCGQIAIALIVKYFWLMHILTSRILFQFSFCFPFSLQFALHLSTDGCQWCIKMCIIFFLRLNSR